MSCAPASASHSVADNLPNNTQEIRTHDLLNVLLGVSAPEQSGGEVRHFGNVFKSMRHYANAIKVAAHPDVVDASNLHNMINALCGVLDSSIANMSGFVAPEVFFASELIQFRARKIRFKSILAGDEFL